MIKKSLVLITLAVLASCGRTATPTSDSSVTSTGTDTVVTATSTVGDMIARDEGYAQCIENARFTC